MAHHACPDSHWYRTNSAPINPDRSFNKEVFSKGLRLDASQMENVLSMLAEEVIKRGFSPTQSLMEQANKKCLTEALHHIYDHQKDLYGWTAINREIVEDYLWCGIFHKQAHFVKNAVKPSESPALGVSSPQVDLRRNKVTAGPTYASLASPISLGKRSRNAAEINSSDAEVTPPEVKRARTQGAIVDLSKDELTIQQKLETLLDELRLDEIRKRKDLDMIVEERANVEIMLKELLKEEGRLAEVKNEVDKTRALAAAMHAASVANRAESKK